MGEEKQFWNLKDIIPEGFDNLYAETEKDVPKINEYFERFCPDMEVSDFLDLLEFDKNMDKRLSRLLSLAVLMETSDMKDPEAKRMKDMAFDLEMRYAAETRKVNFWLQGRKVGDKEILDDDNAKRFFKEAGDKQYAFKRVRNDFKKHTLSENDEKRMAMYARELVVLNRKRNMIECEFEYDLDIPEDRFQSDEEGPIDYTQSDDPEIREAAFRSIIRFYKGNIGRFFDIYKKICEHWDLNASLRRYESPIALRNALDDVPRGAIETLLDVCSENKEVYQRYFKWKGKEFGTEKLRGYDLYVDVTRIDKNVPFKRTVDDILKAFEDFDPGFLEFAKRIIDEKHVDSHPRENKREGAFCKSVSPEMTPYISMNYDGSPSDASTLTHELGHGIQYLFAKDHSPGFQEASMPLAETASIFSEILLFDKYLKEATDPKMRKSILSGRMRESYVNTMRQTSFVKFEIETHKKISEGGDVEEISDLYLDILKEQFGDSVEIDHDSKYEWASASSFVSSPFYCYSYPFGELLSLSLYSRYKKEGKSFIPKIKKILSYGRSENPQKILEEVGIDITSREFWQGSFDIIKGWQDELERLSGYSQ